MAKDKRHTLLGDMNALNLDDAGALTDPERKTLDMNEPIQSAPKRKKAM